MGKLAFQLAFYTVKALYQVGIYLMRLIANQIEEYNKNAPQREAARKLRNEQREAERIKNAKEQAIRNKQKQEEWERKRQADIKRNQEAAANRPKSWQEIEREAIAANVARQKPIFDAQAYAKYNTHSFVQAYEMYYRSGQHNKIPPAVLEGFKLGDPAPAVYSMLYNHKLRTGQSHPSP